MRAKGIDISHYQGSYTPKKDIDFVIIKATEGKATDPKFFDLLEDTKDIQIRGAYHYYKTEVDAIQQADYFATVSEGKGLHFLAVDYERTNNLLDADGAAGLLNCLDWLRCYQKLPVILYTNPYIYRDNVACHWDGFCDFRLWLARWNNNDPDTADPTEGILDREWTFWQYSAKGNGKGAEYGVESADVDLNVYSGTPEELQAWLESYGEPPLVTVDIQEMLDKLTRLALANTARLDTLQQGQLELAESGLGYEEELDRLEHQHNEDIHHVEYRIDGLAGGHNHPKIFRWLGLVKD